MKAMDLNLNTRTGDGRFPPKKDTVMVQRLFLYRMFCVLPNFSRMLNADFQTRS